MFPRSSALPFPLNAIDVNQLREKYFLDNKLAARIPDSVMITRKFRIILYLLFILLLVNGIDGERTTTVSLQPLPIVHHISSLPSSSFHQNESKQTTNMFEHVLYHNLKSHPKFFLSFDSTEHLEAPLDSIIRTNDQICLNSSPNDDNVKHNGLIQSDLELNDHSTHLPMDTINITDQLISLENMMIDPSCTNILNLCNLRYSLSWTIVLFIAYLVVFFIGLFGNLSVLWIVYMLKGETKRRHSCIVTSAINYGAAAGTTAQSNNHTNLNGLCQTNHSGYYCTHHYTNVPVININRSNVVFYRFVCNLALADLLVVLFCLPPTLIGNIYLPWVLGRMVCKAVPYLQGVSVNASVYTLVAISIDRFYAIYYPLSKKCSTAMCWCTILLIWILSFAISFPWLVYFEVIPVNGGEYNPTLNNGQPFQVCRDIWPSLEMEQAHFLIVNLGLQYLIPLSVIALFYILILKKISERKLPKLARHLPSNVKDGNRQSSLVIERSKVKVFKCLIVLVLLFALSWLPLYIIFFIIKIGPRLDDQSMASTILDTGVPVAQWLGASNSCVNPILYFFFNTKFRSYYRNSWLKTFSCLSFIRPSFTNREDKSTVTAV